MPVDDMTGELLNNNNKKGVFLSDFGFAYVLRHEMHVYRDTINGGKGGYGCTQSKLVGLGKTRYRWTRHITSHPVHRDNKFLGK